MKKLKRLITKYSIFEYLTFLFTIGAIFVIFKIPGAIKEKNLVKQDLVSAKKAYIKAYDAKEKREKSNTSKDTVDTQLTAKNTDEIMSSFVSAQNNYLRVYSRKITDDTSAELITRDTDVINAGKIFGTGIVPTLSSQNGLALVNPMEVKNPSISVSGLTPIGDQRYDGIFTVMSNGEFYALYTFIYDSAHNVIGNISTVTPKN